MRPLTARLVAAGRSAWEWTRRAADRLLVRVGARRAADQPGWSAPFLSEVLSRYGFHPEAAAWMRRGIPVVVDDPHSNRGGGFWLPAQRMVRLFSAQHEAAVHELAHAWWHFRRVGQEQALMNAVARAAAEPNPRYHRVRDLAHGYIHGTPHDGWPGLMVDRNDWEMFAGLASGVMGDMGLLPPYLRAFYRGLFREPEELPAPDDASGPRST